MKFFVMRHCYAGSPSSDPKAERERPLTAEGRATALAMAKAIDATGDRPLVAFCSPFTRTTQTADIVGKCLGIQVNVLGGLAPNRPLETEILNLAQYDDLHRILIVGHVDNTTPAMNNLGGDVDWDKLLMGEIRRLKMSRKDASWKLSWAITPGDIGRPDHAS